MSIDNCIKMLIAKEKCMERETSGIDVDCNLHNCDNCSLCYEQGTMGEQQEVLKLAIDTMRKYEQIEQIIKDHEIDRIPEEWIPEDFWYINKIREVIEDGNNKYRD